MATHSPVVLQEVPKNCIWKLRRSGREVNADRPSIEAFGENVGILTREVFRLEVTHSGFHRMLVESINDNNSFEEILADYNEELGDEAKAILQALLIARDQNEDFDQ